MSKAEKKEFGVAFPKNAEGRRSTIDVGKAIIAASLDALKLSEKSQKCRDEKNWRWGGYLKHFTEMVRGSCVSNDKALAASTAGLAEARKQFKFIERSGNEIPFTEYMKKSFTAFETNEVIGTGKHEAPYYSVNYKNKELKGEELIKQVDKWAEVGTIEPDAAASIRNIASRPLDLKDKCFVLFGAGSQMGPFNKLTAHGATVIAIDVRPFTEGPDGKKTPLFPNAEKAWPKLEAATKQSYGKMIYPTKKKYDSLQDAVDDNGIGCNIIEEAGELLEWLKTVCPGKDLVLGNYTYMDADNFVKLSVAIDWIMESLMEVRPVSLSLLCTPTDLHIVPKAATEAAAKNYAFKLTPKCVMMRMIKLLSLGKWLKPNYIKPVDCDNGSKIYLCASASTEQGPSYLLAKRLQTWRYQLAFNGHKNCRAVSINIAPSTATASVYKNKFIRWSMEGWSFFRPMEVFQPDTSNTLMGGLLINDVTDPDSAANPVNRAKLGLTNVVSVVSTNSAHGGMWRNAFDIDSMGISSAIIYLLGGGALKLPHGPIFTTMFYSIFFALIYVLKSYLLTKK